MSLADILAPGLRVVIAGTISARHRAEREHYYAGPGNQFWVLLHESGLTPRRLDRPRTTQLLGYGIGLTDLVGHAGPPVRPRRLRRGAPARRRRRRSRSSARPRRRATRERRGSGRRAAYGALSWTVAGVPAFVLPGPSGANNGMPLPLRIALWRDLADFLESL